MAFLHRLAQNELDGGVAYYAREGGLQLGLDFLAEFERVATVVINNPMLGTGLTAALTPALRHNHRRYVMNRFPYTVVYVLDAHQAVRILAIAHQSRKPYYWYRRF